MTTEIDVRPTETDRDILRPAATTARREEEVLRITEGKSGLSAAVARLGPKLRHLGSATAAQDGLRYRPVAWTAIGVIAVAAFLPGRAERAPVERAAASPSPVVTVVTPTTQPASTDDTLPAIPSGPTFTPPPTTTFSPPTTAAFTPPAPTPTTPTSLGGGSAAPTPLAVRGWGWATRVPPGTVPADAVPDGTLPVANRLGQVDRVSFIRLSGTAGSLTLIEEPDGAREALGDAQIAICPILVSDWAEGEAQSFDDAPAWSDDSCVGSVESDDRWVFDLRSFPFRTGPAGFALVPATDAPADFQVAFRVA